MRKSENLWYSIIIIIGFAVAIGIWVFASAQEAKTFNRYRAEDVPAATTWDAMFSELRIEADGR